MTDPRLPVALVRCPDCGSTDVAALTHDDDTPYLNLLACREPTEDGKCGFIFRIGDAK